MNIRVSRTCRFNNTNIDFELEMGRKLKSYSLKKLIDLLNEFYRVLYVREIKSLLKHFNNKKKVKTPIYYNDLVYICDILLESHKIVVHIS